MDFDPNNFNLVSPAEAYMTEYILVSDNNSKVLQSGTYAELRALAGIIRKAGGACTIFKATRG